MKTIEERARKYSKGQWDEPTAIKAYKQGYSDAVENACNIFCHTGCPHKTDSYNCLNNKCYAWKMFKGMMEE